MNLRDFRSQYPQYDDLTDDELAQSLYSRYYSDLKFEDFAAKVGYEPEKPGLIDSVRNAFTPKEPSQVEQATSADEGYGPTTSAAAPEPEDGNAATLGTSMQRGFGQLFQGGHATAMGASQRVIDVMNRVDAGEAVRDVDDPMGYQHMGAEQRRAARAHLEDVLAKNVGGVARHAQTVEAIPQHEAAKRLTQAKSFDEVWGAFTSDPVGVIAHLGAESFPQMLPGLAGAALASPAGVAAGAGAMGAGSYGVEYASSIVQALQESGVDVRNPEQLRAAIADPEAMQAIREKAHTKAAMVGGLDAASGGVASKTLAPARMVGGELAREATSMAAQAPLQGAMGAAGEALGATAAGEDVTPGAVAAEFFGEFAGAPAEVAAMVGSRQQAQTERAEDPAEVAAPIMQAGTLDEAIAAAEAALEPENLTIPSELDRDIERHSVDFEATPIPEAAPAPAAEPVGNEIEFDPLAPSPDAKPRAHDELAAELQRDAAPIDPPAIEIPGQPQPSTIPPTRNTRAEYGEALIKQQRGELLTAYERTLLESPPETPAIVRSDADPRRGQRDPTKMTQRELEMAAKLTRSEDRRAELSAELLRRTSAPREQPQGLILPEEAADARALESQAPSGAPAAGAATGPAATPPPVAAGAPLPAVPEGQTKAGSAVRPGEVAAELPQSVAADRAAESRAAPPQNQPLPAPSAELPQASAADFAAVSANVDPRGLTKEQYIERVRQRLSVEADRAIADAEALPEDYRNGVWDKARTVAQVKARYADRSAENLMDLRAFERDWERANPAAQSRDYTAPRTVGRVRKGEVRVFKTEKTAAAFAKAQKLKGYTPREVGPKEWVLSRPPLTPAQQANAQRLRDRAREIRPTTDSLRTLLQKAGGINVSELTRDGADPQSVRAALPFAARREGGLSLDAAAEVMAEHGYDVRDESGAIDLTKARELIQDVLDGKEVFSPQGFEERAAQAEQERLAAIPGGEKRGDTELRAAVSDLDTSSMTREQLQGEVERLRREIGTDTLTSLPNRRAWKQARASAPKTVVAALDVDSLGWVNDNMGHQAGDDYLRMVAQALRDEGVEAYRTGGDELMAQAESEEALREALARVRERLKRAEVIAIKGDQRITKNGVGLSYGFGPDEQTADADLYQDKRWREDAGERAPKTREPPGVVRAPAVEAGPGGVPPSFARSAEEIAPETPPQSGVSASEPSFDLTGETEAQIRAREAREAKESAAKRRRDAAPGPEGFVLTGSDRPADEAEARGQGRIPFARQPRVKGLQPKYIRSLLSPIVASWTNGPDLEVIASMDEAPREVRQLDQRLLAQGATGKPYAFFYDGRVYLVANEVHSERQAIIGLFHESLGHYGLRGLYGDRLDGILNQIAVGRLSDVSAKAHEYGLDLGKRADRLVAAEEILAEFAQTRPELGFIQRAIAAIRNWLRSKGVDLEWTDNDILQAFIIPARNWVERGYGKPPGAQPSTFARQGAPVFYSELARQVEGVKTESASAEQWRATLKNLKGVKADELEWSGVMDWLAMRQGKVTKAEVREFLAQNGVKVDEVMLGEEVTSDQELYQERDDLVVQLDAKGYDVGWDHRGDNVVSIINRRTKDEFHAAPVKEDEEAGTHNLEMLREDVLPLAQRLIEIAPQTNLRALADGETTRFSQYTLPGGQNYRELLLTLPVRERAALPNGARLERDPDAPANGEMAWTLRAADGEILLEEIDGRTEAEARINAERKYQDLMVDDRRTAGERAGQFRSSHFDTPNILAHVRFDERTDAEGKRVLFIEEIQSDWAQKGKREGFAPRDAETAGWSAQQDTGGLWEVLNSAGEMMAHVRASDEADAIRRATGYEHARKVPAAPFVGKTEAWLALAVKRMIRYAAENGFERVAWTTGEQQAERYDLAKYIDEVQARNRGGEKFDLQIFTKGPNARRIGYDDRTAAELTDIVGKELADKITQQASMKWIRYGGLDLKVGGEGMKAFYDVIVPGVVRDVLRKLGVRPHSAGQQAEAAQIVRDRGLVDVKAIRDLALSKAFIDKGFEGLDAQAKRLVQTTMLLVGKDDQVLKAVVRAIPIDVVNVLRAKKLSPEVFFHDPAMLVDDLARDLRADMPGGVDVGTALVRAIAKAGAEDVAAGPSRVARGAMERGAAAGASDDGHGLRQIVIPGVGSQPGFDITPEMQERVAKGVPLFARTQATAAQPVHGPAQGPGPWRPGSWQAPIDSKLDRLIYTLQNKHIDTKRVISAISATGRQIADPENPYLQEELFHGRAAKRVQDFLDQELKPLLKEMAERNVDMAEFEEWLHARHARERNAHIATINPQLPDGGSGMTNSDAADVLARARSAGKENIFRSLATSVDAINQRTRQEMIAYGLEDPAAVQAWEAAYSHYVPLQREDMEGGMGAGMGFSIRGGQKRATGSERRVVDILANIALQRERTIARGEKSRVGRALLGLAVANPNPDFWRVDQPPMLKRVDERTGMVVSYVDPLYKSRDNVFMVRMPGPGGVVEHAVVFNEHDERAMRMVQALKNLDLDEMGVLLGTAAKFTRYFASINTQYNPVFGVVNLTRDVQGALVNLTSTPIAGHQREVFKHTRSALVGIYIDQRDARLGRQPNSRWAALWDEFTTEGGQTGYRDLFRTSADRAKSLEAEIRRAQNKGAQALPRRAWRFAFDWLSDYNLAMENAVRLAAYKVAIDQGISKSQAASIAKNLTVNFNRKGQAATQAGALYAFFNASMQGTARMYQTLAGPKGKQIVAGGVLLGALQAVALALAGFDEDEPPEFVRERNIIIPIGGKKYITIPMPLGLHVLPNIGRIPMEFAIGGFRNGAERVGNMLGLIAEAFNPMGSAGLSVQTLAPTVIDPLVALSENRDWTGKPIARQDFNRLAPTPGHTRAKDVATAPARWMSYALNALTGGTEHKPGIFSPTPDQLDYLVGQLTGGVGREASKVLQTASAMMTGEDLPPYKIPLVGRLYGDASSSSAEANRFYANLKELNEHEAEIKGRRKAGEPTSQYLRDNPEARLVGFANSVERQVSQLRRRKREMKERQASRERIEAIDADIRRRMERFNELVRRRREQAR